LVSAAFLLAAACHGEPSALSETEPVAAPDPQHATIYVPEGKTLGGRTTLPLVFPDGTRLVASYPSRLEIRELGAQPDVSYLYRRDPGGRFALTFVHGPARAGAGTIALHAGHWTIPFR
jgi:hypothetical protein